MRSTARRGTATGGLLGSLNLRGASYNLEYEWAA